MRIIVDTDLGIGNDDFFALCLALSARSLHLEAVSVCPGNYSMKQALWNALSVLEYLDREDVPVLAGAALPLRHVYAREPGAAFGYWGDVKRATWPFSTPAMMRPHRLPAAEWLRRRLAVSPPATLVAIGPLTNIALALRRGPLRALERIVLMGGSSDQHGRVGGNASGRAEFNFWVDPDAAAEVLSAGHPITLLPLHVWARVEIGLDHLLQARDLPSAVARLMRTVLLAQQLQGRSSVPVGDALAIAILLWPELFRVEAWHAAVVTTPGRDYGRLVLRKPRAGEGWVDVVVDVDARTVVKRMLRDGAPGRHRPRDLASSRAGES